MTFDPNGGGVQTTTVGELVDWLAENPGASCGCENPQPYNLCCPARLIYDTPRVIRDAQKRKLRR